MSSLAELRRRLACLDKRPQSDTGSVDILVKPDTSPENRANGNTGTIEITENRTWLDKIEVQGNRAEDWLEYTRYISQHTEFTSKIQQHNYLSEVYENAFEVIDVVLNKRNEAYAQLFLDWGQLISQLCPDDAIQLMNHARSVVRRFAMIHVVSAELEYQQGNVAKAKKILDKAALYGAEPLSTITMAMERLNEGHVSLQETVLPPEPAKPTEEPKQRGPGRIRKMPQRVKVMNMPFKEIQGDRELEDKENDTTPYDIKPLDSHTNYTLGSISMAHSSGYCSMMDISNSTETKMSPPQPEDVKKASLATPEEVVMISKAPKLSGLHLHDNNMDGPGERRPLQVLDSEPMDVEFNPANFPGMSMEQMCRERKQSCDSSNSCGDPYKQAGFPKSYSLSSVVDPQSGSRRFLQGLSYTKTKALSSGQLPCGDRVHTKESVNSCQLDPKTLPSSRLQSGIGSQPNSGTSLDCSDARTCPDVQRQKAPKPSTLPPSDCRGPSQPPHHPLAPPGVCPSQPNGSALMAPTPVKGPALIGPTPVKGSALMGPTPVKGSALMGQTPVQGSALMGPTPVKGSALMGQTPVQGSALMGPTPVKGSAMMGPTPVKDNSRAQPHNAMMTTPSMKGVPPMVASTPSSLMMKDITVNGKQYWVLKLVGRGGSSKVYKVMDRNLDNRAIKVVDLRDANEQILDGYKNEIRLLERLQYCSKVIKMYDYEHVVEHDKLYIVMEHGTVDFANFIKNRLKEDGHLSPNAIKFYWEDMLQAVGALHKQGIIHSDLKPSNFLVIDGTLRLIDFGIAKSIQCDKTSVVVDTQVGTLNYMSPESIVESCGSDGDGQRSKPTYKLGVKSDVWSLGCILYYMVYGQTPFQKITKTFIKLQAIINPNYPIEFKDISDKNLLNTIQKCLIRDPRERAGIADLLAHPYITNRALPEDKTAASPPCTDDHLERLVKQLSTKFASSPSGIRSMVVSAMQDRRK